MIDEGKVANREAMVLVVVLNITELFLTFMAELAEVGKSGAWLIVLIATVVTAVFFLPTALLAEKFPEKSIVEVGEELAGPYLNGIFSFIFTLFFLVSAAVVLRQYAERVLTVSIPELPISVAMGGMLLGSLAACMLGLEAMARSSLFIFYFIGFTVLLVSLLTYPYWQFGYLFPLAGAGTGTLLKEGIFRSSLLTGVLLLPVIFPSLKTSRIRLTGLLAIGTGGLTIAFTMVAMLMTFETSVLQNMSLPSFELTRLIYLGRFLQRLESIFVPIWALVGMMHIAIGIYAASAVITRFLRLPYHRPFVLPVGIISYALAFLPVNLSQVLWVDFNLVRAYGFVPALILPALIYFAAWLRKRGGGSVEKGGFSRA